MKPSDNEIEMLAAGFAIQHKNGLIRFAHALLEKYASARAMTFDGWLAKHCDSSDLTDYERELARDAWNAALPAPQASEAVRNALKTCGSKVLKALAAIARADGPDTRREDDPELIYREPVMDEVVRIRQAYDELSAALSAQPGTQQKENDS